MLDGRGEEMDILFARKRRTELLLGKPIIQDGLNITRIGEVGINISNRRNEEMVVAMITPL